MISSRWLLSGNCLSAFFSDTMADL
jgi:hypothetical protein